MWKNDFTEQQVEGLFALLELQDEESRQRFLDMKRLIARRTESCIVIEKSDNVATVHEEKDDAELE